ncbi:MAG TPA: Ig-like domain-containing protein [Bryobacteraceae bacterium]|nr:Ig-like domain-containing protein [Bryobacteraceae bacterium]
MTIVRGRVCSHVTSLMTVVSVVAIAALTPAPISAQIYPGTDWELSTPQAEGMDPAKFDAAMANMPAIAVVIRNGKIIGAKGDITRSGPLYSGSKTLLATLAGLLLQQGKITMETLIPWSDRPAPPLASLRHFLTMTSDFNLTPHSPGDHYAYSNSGAIRYGQHLMYTFYPGRTEIQALRDAYLDKLGIQDAFSLVGAISGWGGGGFIMSTRDLARVGYLILKGGAWNGEQLLPPWFVEGLYVSQIPDTATAGGTGSGEVDNQVNVTPRLPGTYSWGFWLPHGRAGYEGSRSTTVACTTTGSYGTSMHVIPKYDMILAGVNTVSTAAGGRISGALIDQFADAVLANTASGDTTAPSVSLSSPTQGATVSGTVTVSANASDNIGVAGVQFLVDGQPIAAEAISPPYSALWNTASVANGAHTVSVRARDACGNSTTASVSVTVASSTSSTMSITRFVLIDADTDQPVAGFDPLANGAVINLRLLPSRNLNVAAITEPATVGSVKFALNGSIFRTETAAPYALAGDTSGNYYPWNPAPGSYSLTAVPFSGANASGSPGAQFSVSFTVVDQATGDGMPPTVTMTAPTPNATVQGAVVVSADATDDTGVAGVLFLLDGAPFCAEATSAPYAVTWDTTGLSGSHTLSARARDAAGNLATATPITVTIGAPPPPPAAAVTSVALINANTDQPIAGFDPIADGTVIQRSGLPTSNLNILARTSGGGIASVAFVLNGSTVRVENVAPYTIGGDSGGDYWPWALPAGSHTLTLTPYSGTNATGTPGQALTVKFTVQ